MAADADPQNPFNPLRNALNPLSAPRDPLRDVLNPGDAVILNPLADPFNPLTSPPALSETPLRLQNHLNTP